MPRGRSRSESYRLVEIIVAIGSDCNHVAAGLGCGEGEFTRGPGHHGCALIVDHDQGAFDRLARGSVDYHTLNGGLLGHGRKEGCQQQEHEQFDSHK